MLSRLNNLKAAKPRRLKTLASTVSSLFQQQLSDSEVAALLDELQRSGTITVHDGKVSYELGDHLLENAATSRNLSARTAAALTQPLTHQNILR